LLLARDVQELTFPEQGDREMTEQATADERPEEGFQSDKPRHMLNISQVLEIVPVGRTTLFKMERQGTFPTSTYISPNRRCWYADEIARWQKALPPNSRLGRRPVQAGSSD
jgi:predicted DNA-binding transcriptional regulator AlpA